MRTFNVIGKVAGVVFAAIALECFVGGQILMAGFWLGLGLFCVVLGL